MRVGSTVPAIWAFALTEARPGRWASARLSQTLSRFLRLSSLCPGSRVRRRSEFSAGRSTSAGSEAKWHAASGAAPLLRNRLPESAVLVSMRQTEIRRRRKILPIEGLGRSSGLPGRSASETNTHSPRLASIPLRMLAPFPTFTELSNTRRFSKDRRHSPSTAELSSVDPSSTMITSAVNGRSSKNSRRHSNVTGRIAASLWAGMTIDK